jgi:UDP-N-acetylenolpyruvoylglucosamine reductase
MPIKTITYKRIKNLGNYQSKTLEATSIVNENDDPDEELKTLIALVDNELFPPEPVTNERETEILEIKRGQRIEAALPESSAADTEDAVEPPF